jgi:hypothetical protein
LINGVVDVVTDRAPWLSDQAYRAVATPLQWVDPVGGARVAEARLDDIRDRVTRMAARGRVSRVEQRRIPRDLLRTHEDLERVASRLPAVHARALALRLAGYAEALAALPGRPDVTTRRPRQLRPTRVRDAVLATGAAAATTGVLLPTVGVAGVEGGLAAGVATALGVTAVRYRRARKEQLGAVAAALTAADAATRGPNGVHARDLDGARRALIGRALSSGRLDDRGVETLRRLDTHLDDLLVRLVEDDLEADASYLVQATVTRYLPDTLEPLLSMPDPRAEVRGRPAVVEVADQLASIERGLADLVGRGPRTRPETLLLLQGEFLRSKFGDLST